MGSRDEARRLGGLQVCMQGLIRGLARALAAIGGFVLKHPIACCVAAAAVAVLAVVEFRWVRKKRPAELSGNGIAIGQAKAFDNRSLALRVERLTASLEQIKVVNQDAPDNLQAFQQRTISESSDRLSVKSNASSKDAKPEAKPDAKPENTSTGANPDFKPKFGLAAADVLSDQLNLASQIFNLQTLYERSLTDRLIGGQPRLQTVLGFQVSINPPGGLENCVAVVEIAARLQADPTKPASGPVPISLVALMPQEKTYNAELIRSTERSIDGSAVASILTLGASGRQSAKQFFLHRDSDIIAFERAAGTKIQLHDAANQRLRFGWPKKPAAPTRTFDNAAIFGWEFRPVLGRRAVSAGTRQLLAVVSIPLADGDAASDAPIEIQTRSYWRRYNRASQTSTPKWSWLPWRVDRSDTRVSDIEVLTIPNTVKIQSSLAPTIGDIRVVNTGSKQATVVVSGSNFFTGTKIVTGGITYSAETNNLTLKSDRSVEFETSLDALTTGDAVLSGRFGPSIQLALPDKNPTPPIVRTVAELSIAVAEVTPLRNSRALRINVSVIGRDGAGQFTDVTFAFFSALPNPMLFVGTELVPMPYDYVEQSDSIDKPIAGGKRLVKVGAWISSRMLAKNPSVTFQVPFCGQEYQSSKPLIFSEPTLVRMGEDSSNESVFRIFYPQGLGSRSFQIDLDTTYIVDNETLQKITDTEYRFKVPTKLVSQFQNIVLRVSDAEPYVLSIPSMDKPRIKPSVDAEVPPVQVDVNKRGPVTWTGQHLDAISDVTITPPGATSPMTQPFAVYAEGTKLIVYLTAGATTTEGRLAVECSTTMGDKLNLPLFIVAP
jgi:hypothetical protein